MARFLNAPADASSADNGKGNFEQALGFINMGLPNSNGTISKLTMAPLKASNAAEKELFEALMADEAALLTWIKENMVLTFRPNTSGSKAIGFAFKK